MGGASALQRQAAEPHKAGHEPAGRARTARADTPLRPGARTAAGCMGKSNNHDHQAHSGAATHESMASVMQLIRMASSVMACVVTGTRRGGGRGSRLQCVGVQLPSTHPKAQTRHKIQRRACQAQACCLPQQLSTAHLKHPPVHDGDEEVARRAVLGDAVARRVTQRRQELLSA